MNANIESVVLFAIDQTSKVAKQYAQREFDLLGLGITVEQWVLLKVIHEKKDLSQNELAHATHRDPASITRTLDLLQKKGLVVREAILENRRQYNIKLTETGNNFIEKNMPLINKLRNISIKGFTKKETDTLLLLLEKMQKNMV